MGKGILIKRIGILLAVILTLNYFSACGENGKQEEDQSFDIKEADGQEREGDAVYDLASDTERIISARGIGQGIQFYQGEPVLLQTEQNIVDSETTVALYLCDQEGERRLHIAGLPKEAGYGTGFLDEEGCYYHIITNNQGAVSITKYSRSGEAVYTLERQDAVNMEMFGIADGKIMLRYSEGGSGSELQIMETSTGRTTGFKLNAAMPYFYMGTDGEGCLCVMDNQGIYRVDLEQGKIKDTVLSFEGSSYNLDAAASENGRIKTFRVTEGGDVEILRQGLSGSVTLEKLGERNLDGKDKVILTIRGVELYEVWMKDKITEFNNHSEDCYVKVEVCGEGTDEEDYITRTKIELTAGEGPDILYGDELLGPSVYELVQNGVLENLVSYMERSDMEKEDYFPVAFCDFQVEGCVYGINPMAWIYSEAVDGNLLEGMDRVRPQPFLDELLKLGDKRIYQDSTNAAALLRNFLQGSDSLWGMVDREKGGCRFDTELFAELLKVAKNLGDDDRKSYEPVAERLYISSFYNFLPETSGKTVTGCLFDEGCHGVVDNSFMLAVNASSKNKEAAWEFISYLLSEEVQNTMSYNRLPVNRKIFADHVEKELAEGLTKNTYSADGGLISSSILQAEPLTEESAAVLKGFLEDARFLPVRNRPILDIILEEARDYFDGRKDIPQVVQVIENRVNLYLQEQVR